MTYVVKVGEMYLNQGHLTKRQCEAERFTRLGAVAAAASGRGRRRVRLRKTRAHARGADFDVALANSTPATR